MHRWWRRRRRWWSFRTKITRRFWLFHAFHFFILENFIRICPSNRLDILIKDSSRLIVYINYILLKIDYWGGWACFVVSIFIIGVLTAVIGDLASHFGCTIGLKDSVTAISFVALGTSLPGLIQKFFWL